ncbi:N-acetyllactosaminide alpha-1,3-galactosyltransferase-like isoform X1 [Melanotaenia boesemani]|uniref:N-acetyllactosaminide alpha-1,3-galactosyltransferase-like isoform X2 n=1 Tax=Melanotaenia boesemani TaxID=1250792 RepID=UPI001C053EB8|nr:N-acetyllactosaminide alpha-1,3-galactosyltransferase-like isoform X2 [Melanotaenia boesemani]XP_041845227.1 N-acetyllactosaminide alpha-1,3-galactosyltransferase-like isoform X1 [Melanotaenia boesemani]
MRDFKERIGIFTCLLLCIVLFSSFYFGQLRSIALLKNLPVIHEEPSKPTINLDHTLDFTIRNDVQTRTYWGAPIIWELMFDPKLYDKKHQEGNTSVALTVFAVGRYLDAYLNTFLTSAEKHFMIGLPVTYYVFTESPEKVPNIELAPQRDLKVVKVQKYSRWQDISMMRMKTISETIEMELEGKFSYVFCFDVDQEFKNRFGSEALGESVALLHADFYNVPKDRFTYDKNPKSKAYMEDGDHYYHAALFGGSLQNVKALADFCHVNIMEDKLNDVEALWHDESHLNKFFWLNKPTQLLSPEYCWDNNVPDKKHILVVRLTWAPKQYDKLRTR